MKCLTIRQPWAELIAAGTKRIENRTWQTNYRGPIAIHAARKPDDPKWKNYSQADWSRVRYLPRGAIIATVNLLDIVTLDEIAEDESADQDREFATGPYCWILRNPRRIRPIYCTGKLSLWDPSPEILEQLTAKLPTMI